MGRAGVVDDPVILGMLVVEVKYVLEQKTDGCGQGLSININKPAELGGMHLGTDDMHLGLDLEVADVSRQIFARVHVMQDH